MANASSHAIPPHCNGSIASDLQSVQDSSCLLAPGFTPVGFRSIYGYSISQKSHLGPQAHGNAGCQLCQFACLKGHSICCQPPPVPT